MIATDRTFEGWQASLRPSGFGRFFAAAFLGFWLCGWLAGEAFALVFLAGLGWPLVTGAPIHASFPHIAGPGLWLVGGFILIWLTLWTFGGVTALWALLRLLWGEDRIAVRPEGLRLERRAAPLRRSRSIPRDQLRRLYRLRGSGLRPQLMAETSHGSIRLTEFATPDELSALEADLNRELGIKPPSAVQLPPNWERLDVPEGGTVLVAALRRRRRGGAIVALLAATFGVTTFWSAATHQVIAALVCTVPAGLLAWGAWRLLLGRYEWRWRAGLIHLDWRCRGALRTVCTGERLQLGVSSDSDNDDWYRLELLGRPVGPGGRETRRLVAQCARDPSEPRALGEWLARESGVAFVDLSAAADRTAELEAMRRKLAASGAFGRWMAKLMPPTKPRA